MPEFTHDGFLGMRVEFFEEAETVYGGGGTEENSCEWMVGGIELEPEDNGGNENRQNGDLV